MFWRTLIAAFSVLAFTQQSAFAADTVFLRKTCGSLTPCVTTSAGLESYIASNPPSQSAPLTADVGPGEFGPFSCLSTSDLGLKGAGRQQTVFNDSSGGSTMTGGLNFEDCDRLSLQDLSARGTAIGVSWKGSGKATLTNVDVEGGGGSYASYGWWDRDCGTGEAEIFWFGSRIAAVGGNILNFALYPQCGEHWIYGSDVVAQPPASTLTLISNAGIFATNGSDVRVFGGTVRALVGDAVNTTFTGAGSNVPNFVAVYLSDSTFHMHGGIINASAGNSNHDVDVIGIKSDGASTAHTPDTAFVLSAGQLGQTTRLAGPGTVLSPFLWPPSDSPPVDVTVHGSDQYVDTDAGTAADEAHLMVYDDSCTSKWRDMTDGVCAP